MSRSKPSASREESTGFSRMQEELWLPSRLAPLLSNMQRIWALAALVRAVLILWGAWQDSNLVVKYTDVDYMVFSDAARFVADGESPYLRATYRYTPLLAYLLLPNVWLSMVWGKLVFAATDLVVGVLLHHLLLFQCGLTAERAAFYTCLWLFNPIVVNVSTRGNAEAVVSLLVVGGLWGVQTGRFVVGGLIFGLAVHFKLYPIIYALPLYLSIPSALPPSSSAVARFFDVRRLVFTAASIFSCGIATLVFWRIYGYTFLYEAYLYHVTRADHRHNFSLYFYQLYLSQQGSAALTGLVAFVPQVVLLLALSYKFGSKREVALCLCCQTVAFVALNKVYTVQYFVWYLALLPLALANGHRHFSWWWGAGVAGWVLGGMGTWLGCAYLLEFEGEPMWLALVGASCLLFSGHMALFSYLISHYR